MLLRHLTPFDWKFLQIGTLRAKDLRKNVSILQEGGLTPVSHTLLVIRVVLLHTLYSLLNPSIPQLYISKESSLTLFNVSRTAPRKIHTMANSLRKNASRLGQGRK